MSTRDFDVVVVGAGPAGEVCAGRLADKVPLERLWHAVPCFPTRSELWLNLLEEYGRA